MKVGDNVWAWDHWYNLIQIEIRTIEEIDKMDVVNSYFSPDWLSFTKEEAREKLKVFIRQEIESRKVYIKYLEEKLEGIQ